MAALDDAVALIAFSICAAVVSGSSEGVSVMDTVLPVVYNVGMLAFGALLGFVMVKLLTPARSKEHRLALACAFLFLEAGVSAALDVSPMLGAMATVSYTHLNPRLNPSKAPAEAFLIQPLL